MPLQHGDPITVLDTLIKECTLYFGVTDVTMFRGEGLCFMRVGKYMERRLQSAEILDVKLSDQSYDLDRPDGCDILEISVDVDLGLFTISKALPVWF
jgi:uncharacterized alpha-E superfamily protein